MGGLYLNPRGRSTFGLGICQRCQRRFSLEDLTQDDQSGLILCQRDIDELDPYRLPPRAPDPIALRFYSPDTPMDNNPSVVGAIVALNPTPDPVSTVNDIIISVSIDEDEVDET
jgi:hypothetical protein